MPPFHKVNLGMGRKKAFILLQLTCLEKKTQKQTGNPKTHQLKLIENLGVANLYTEGVSNVNYQFHTYYSYKADPETSGVDSLTEDWSFLEYMPFHRFR